MVQKKLIAIIGPTASGKSSLAVLLAKKFNGEIISADSRQIYKGMDIGSGKITKKEMMGIPHHLLDVSSPKTNFSVSRYQRLAKKSIERIFKNGRNPILCGGSGFYVQAVTDGIIIPKVKPDWRLRKILGKKNSDSLFKMLRKLDPKRAKNIDKKNPRRIIRAIEIVKKTKRPVSVLKSNPPDYPILILGIKKSKEELKKKIKNRLKKRLRSGMVAEVKNLKKSGLSWKRLEEFGLEYRWVSRYLQRKISHKEMAEKLQKDIEHFAKRQMTWFSRDKKIVWIKNRKEAKKKAKIFLQK